MNTDVKRRKGILFLSLILVIVSLSGCFSKSYPHRTQYMFDVSKSYLPRGKKAKKTLEISSITIAPPFAGSNFVYRTSHFNYQTDYYHTFFIPPARQIGHTMTNYLKTTHLFRYVTEDDDFNHANYHLHIHIQELYADYRNRNQPLATIAIQFILFEPTDTQTQIRFNKTFKETIPLSFKDSRSLVAGWNKGLTRICERLTRELFKVA